jgi:hypothetical protein
MTESSTLLDGQPNSDMTSLHLSMMHNDIPPAILESSTIDRLPLGSSGPVLVNYLFPKSPFNIIESGDGRTNVLIASIF